MEEYVKTLAKISGELWKVFKSVCMDWHPEKDEWWEIVINAMDGVSTKYIGTEYEPYTRAYAVSLVNEIERKYRKEKIRGLTNVDKTGTGNK